MKVYFKIKLEFERSKVLDEVDHAVRCGQKGYVCVVDGNVLANSHKDPEYRQIINGALTNTCDGGSIALLVRWLHHIRTSTYTGPELFNDCINKKYRQVFLGNSKENLQLLKEKFEEQKLDLTLFKFQELPFCKVEDFEYKEISKDVNDFNPDLVWVSLGAPKQEQFISMLFPFIEKGVLFAIGAAFNLYLGKAENKRAPKWMRQIHLEWLFRVFQEPKRVGKRAFAYLILLPKIIIEEKIRINTRRYETIS